MPPPLPQIVGVTPAEWAEWAEAIRQLATTVEPVIDMSRFPASELSAAQHDLAVNGGVQNLTIWEQVEFLHNTAGDAITSTFIAWFEQLMMEANPNFTGLFYWATEQQDLESGFFAGFASAAVYENAFTQYGKEGYGHGYTNSTSGGGICNVCLPPSYGWADAAQNLHFMFHKAQGGQMSNYFFAARLPSESLKLETPLPYFTEYTVDDVQFSAHIPSRSSRPPSGRRSWLAAPPEQRAAHAASFEKFIADTDEKVASETPIEGNVPCSAMRIMNGRRSPRA
ncbi:hypothetical protein BDK51DRAFT_29166 [Blyttiomyces helicus]|uniref:Uncharacterized protein n=1 Tax=Blyttiomyces helicus TaxID=388810 RepID=A0A4P9WBV0_9FUNG|nr:hypothetical protein BDK51DRAFT_29166 [Blyttiomyces helicus]|eukprot:RKO88410.1 hypothetical protein BDK51DRAFT_29166 [Blyttiomyces helicus]